MTARTWNVIKHSKNFYVKSYRAVETVILISIILNLGLGLGVYKAYAMRTEPDYYSTFGETPPAPLVAMDAPNYSSVPLLPDDNYSDSVDRTIPN